MFTRIFELNRDPAGVRAARVKQTSSRSSGWKPTKQSYPMKSKSIELFLVCKRNAANWSRKKGIPIRARASLLPCWPASDQPRICQERPDLKKRKIHKGLNLRARGALAMRKLRNLFVRLLRPIPAPKPEKNLPWLSSTPVEVPLYEYIFSVSRMSLPGRNFQVGEKMNQVCSSQGRFLKN